jgi:peptidoglycan hydrolase CwlO-like protein
MRYKQPVQNKLDQLENMLTGFSAKFSDPNFNINTAREMIEILKDKVEEIRTLINNENDN